MRRHWIAFAALALLPLALMAVSPPIEAPASEAPTEAVEAPVETGQPAEPADLEALEDALFLPEAEETSNHCCPPGTDAICAAACAPDPGFAACSGNTCFCVCVIIN